MERPAGRKNGQAQNDKYRQNGKLAKLETIGRPAGKTDKRAMKTDTGKPAKPQSTGRASDEIELRKQEQAGMTKAA